MNKHFLSLADANLPELKNERICPSVEPTVLGPGSSVVIDLGNHYVGTLSFRMEPHTEYIDAPVRLLVRFCEVERELCDDYSTYNGWLCRSWLQDEVVNIDFPGIYTMPRRYAARYVRIDVLYTPKKLVLSDFVFTATSAVSLSDLRAVRIDDPELAAIDRVAVNTLKNCMQRVFEDGPKRDRRLWIGDLRLEALANYYTFGDTSLVKRCLYLFAAAERNEHGFMPGYVYENPRFVSGYWFLIDYSLLYVCSLCDYYMHVGDGDTMRELYATARSIVDAAVRSLDSDGIIKAPTSDEDIFIDWCVGLEKKTALHGVYLYTLDLWCRAISAAGYTEDAAYYSDLLSKGREAARCHLVSADGRVVNDRDGGQHSVHSAAWLTLGGVFCEDEARFALDAAMTDENSLKPFTPYMHHYAVEAMLKAGMNKEADAYMRHIWGGMVKTGTDTFFEAYVPADPDFSPYDDRKVNSMCHAWSCTPTYLLRKYMIS
ncbi:MAG: hypothetical protein IJX38_02865 [Clostridia bacterium]|nr:hypothetical protein [Clostridia bacterium]